MKRHRLRAYLSGGMEHAPREGSAWRDEVETWLRESLGHDAFNPSRESKKLQRRWLPAGANFRLLKTRDPHRFLNFVRRIIKRDLKEVQATSDYLICLWDRRAHRGGGTVGEITIAYHYGKPIYIVTRMRRENIPAWILGCATEVFSSFAQLQGFLKRRYG